MVVEGRVPEKTCVGRPTLVVSRTTKRNADWRKFVNENLSYTCCKAEYRKTKKDKGHGHIRISNTIFYNPAYMN